MEYLRRLGSIHGGYTDLSIELPTELVKLAVHQVDDAIDAKLTPRRITMIVLGTFLAAGIAYVPADAESDEVTSDLYDAAYAGAKWASENGRNGLGYVCAIARYVRDAGGDWKVPETLSRSL